MTRAKVSLWLPLAGILMVLGCRLASPASPSPTAPTLPPTPTRLSPIPSPVCTARPSPPCVVLGNTSFVVELAVTPQERARGLMGREHLGRDEGMLFIFESDLTPGFWMKGMLIPLDLVWLDAQRVVVAVTPSVPPAPADSNPPLYYPPDPIHYVLEINAGRAAAADIRPGVQATLSGIGEAR